MNGLVEVIKNQLSLRVDTLISIPRLYQLFDEVIRERLVRFIVARQAF